MPTKKVYLLPTLLLKKVWIKYGDDWLNQYPEVEAKNKDYITKNVAIPVDVLLDAIAQEMRQAL